MKNPIKYHIDAVKIVAEQLSKGNFLIYFVPAILITTLFLLVSFFANLVFGDPATVESTGWFSVVLSKVGSVVDFIVVQLYIFFILTILSPFNTILSEKLDTRLTGTKFSFSIIRVINDLIRMIFIVLIALLLQLVFVGIWWFICLVTGISDTIIYEVIAFLISAFFFGFSFYDHSLERYEISVPGSLRFAFSNILLITITGIIFKLLYYFPYFWEVSYIGIVIAPVVTTMISTVVYLMVRNNLPATQTDIHD